MSSTLSVALYQSFSKFQSVKMEDPYPAAVQLFSRKTVDLTNDYSEWYRVYTASPISEETSFKTEITETNLKKFAVAVNEAQRIYDCAVDSTAVSSFGISFEELARRREEAMGFVNEVTKMYDALTKASSELKQEGDRQRLLAQSKENNNLSYTQIVNTRKEKIMKEQMEEEREAQEEINGGLDELNSIIVDIKRYNLLMSDELDKQGREIDDITRHVDTTNENIKETTKKMNTLAKKLKKRKPWIFVIVGVILILISILLIVLC